MKELSLDQIHAATVDLLSKFIEICERIEINYFVFWGTLIGAVRHKGFIPWDDDCDVVMLRPDYEKIAEYCKSHASELCSYKLLNRETVDNYPFTLPRFSNMNYKMIYHFEDGVDCGLFIDIYPLDGAGNNYLYIKEHHKHLRALLLRVAYYANERKPRKSNRGGIFNLINIIPFLMGHIVGRDKLLDYFESKKIHMKCKIVNMLHV